MIIRNLETLGDAARAKLQLYASCRNYLCRHEWAVDLDYVMRHVGAAHFLYPVRGKRHFSERMRCPECSAIGVNIEHGERHDFQPLLKSMNTTIEEWDDKDRQMYHLMLSTGNTALAWAAYEKALEIYPRKRILMRQGGHVMADSRLRVIPGGKGSDPSSPVPLPGKKL